MKVISVVRGKARGVEAHTTRRLFSASCLSHKPLTRDISASAEMQILELRGKAYTAVVPNVKAKTLMKHIKEKTKKGSVYYTDIFRSYNSLVIYGKHERIDHTKTLVEYNKHINGIEGFWSYAKERSTSIMESTEPIVRCISRGWSSGSTTDMKIYLRNYFN